MISNCKIFNVLIGVTGSVATVKLIELVKHLISTFPLKTKPNEIELQCLLKIKIVMTRSSQHFVSKEKVINELKDYNNIDGIYEDIDEWSTWTNMGDPVLHIELRKWADLFVIAPLDANTMAKMSNGICDNLITCVVRAWDLEKPLLYCPAMNCHMYEHPLTKEHLKKLNTFGYTCIDPVEKRLACGDVGIGGMSSVETICSRVIELLITDRKNNQIAIPLVDTDDHNKNNRSNNNQPSVPSVVTSLTNCIDKKSTCNNFIDIRSLLNSSNDDSNKSSRLVINISNNQPSRSQNLESKNVSCGRSLLYKPGKISKSSGSKSKSLLPKPTFNLTKTLKTYSKLDCLDSKNGNQEVEYPDFDPSELLEHTMITEDLIAPPNDTTREKKEKPNLDITLADTSLQTNESTSKEHINYLRKFNMSSPVLNIAKFIDLCDNQERSCFTCAICKNDYKNRKSMSRHFREQHVLGSIFRCNDCGVAYKRKEKLIKHNRMRHPNMEDASQIK